MFWTLFIHQVKQAIRHHSWEKQVATNIFLGLLISLIVLNILALGFAMEDILNTFYTDINPVMQFTSFILHYALIDIILRLMMQEVPALGIRPYLLLPIHKGRLVHYLLSKSLWSFFPIIPLLVVFPVAVRILPRYYATVNIVFWVMGIYIFFNFISYIALYLKRKIHFNPGFITVLIVCYFIIIFLQQDGYISVSGISTFLFMLSLGNPLYNFIFLAFFAGAYGINYLYLKRHTYAEEILPKQKIREKTANYAYLKKMGIFGELLALEFRLIFRNRRIRSTVYLSIWMIALAIPFYKYYYPYLEKQPKEANYIQSEVPVAGDREHLVRIRVIPATQPPLGPVCIAGDHPQFGEWKPDLVQLQYNEDSTWTRTFVFDKGTELKFKITGSDWGNEALYEKDIIPDPFSLTVDQDTTLNIHVVAWNKDKVFNTISGAMLIYAGVFFIGMFIITYGQFLYAWEAGYFDFLLIQKIDYHKYLLVKVFLMAATCAVTFLVIAPFLFHSLNAFYSLTVAFLYNLGINLPLMLFLSLYNRTRIDITAGAFSWQGKSGQQMINVLILILAPALISGFLISHFGLITCFWIMGSIGLAGILVLPLTLHFIYIKFTRKKYIMGAAFREPN